MRSTRNLMALGLLMLTAAGFQISPKEFNLLSLVGGDQEVMDGCSYRADSVLILICDGLSSVIVSDVFSVVDQNPTLPTPVYLASEPFLATNSV